MTDQEQHWRDCYRAFWELKLRFEQQFSGRRVSQEDSISRHYGNATFLGDALNAEKGLALVSACLKARAEMTELSAAIPRADK